MVSAGWEEVGRRWVGGGRGVRWEASAAAMTCWTSLEARPVGFQGRIGKRGTLLPVIGNKSTHPGGGTACEPTIKRQMEHSVSNSSPRRQSHGSSETTESTE